MNDDKTERAENALLTVIESLSQKHRLTPQELSGLAEIASAFAELRAL